MSNMSILSSPALVAPAHNPMNYVIDSSNKAQPNYQYILDVYVNSILVATMKNRPNPVYNNYGVFNVAKIIQNFLDSKYFSPGANSTPVSITAHKVDYQIKLSESFTGTVNSNDTVDATRTGYSAALSQFDFSVANYGGFFNKFQTERPTPFISIDFAENFFTTVFLAQTNPANNITITPYTGYNCTGTALTPQVFTISTDVMMNIGTAVLTLGAALSYSVNLKKDATILDTICFNLDVCNRYKTVPIHFLNRLGGYETVYFRLVSKKTVEAQRNTMQEVGYKLNASNVVSYFDSRNVMYETIRPFAVFYKERLTITSEFLTDDEYTWVEQLISSPSIFTERDTYYFPIAMSETTYEPKKREVDQLQNIQFTFEYGQNNNVQFR